MFRKHIRLGKEYKNTDIISFNKVSVNPKKLLTRLEDLGFLSNKEVKKFWEMKDISQNDKVFVKLQKRLNKIAPIQSSLTYKCDDFVHVGFFDTNNQ